MLSVSLIALVIGTSSPGNSSCPGSASGLQEKPSKSIVETAVAAGSFKTLATALKAAGLVEALSGAGPFTVFAPTDTAFAKLPKGTIENLLKPESKETLALILTYHVVAGDMPAADVVQRRNAPALNGQRIGIRVDQDGVFAAGAKVVQTDIVCSNGVIHVVDSVMMPSTKNIASTAVEAGSFQTLAKALTAAGLVEALSAPGPFTVFAPTDEAFAKLPPGVLENLLKPENKNQLIEILKLHVTPGRVFSDEIKAGEVATLGKAKKKIAPGKNEVLVAGVPVTQADIQTSNGVIHVVESVILPKG